MTDRAKGRRALGKGLGALIPGATSRTTTAMREYFSCPVERIDPQAGQPRQQFDDESLTALVESVRDRGVYQPLLVRRSGEQFELIAGERRWRAAQLAGLLEVPVVVKDATAVEAFEIALVENLQREDLNPIEESEAFQRLIDDYGYTQAEISSLVGRDRSTVANSLRLLGLPAEVKLMLIKRTLSEGHARALLQAGTQSKMTALARQAVALGLTVRETERRARNLSANRNASAAAKAASKVSLEVRSLVERLQRVLGARVKVLDKKGKGRIEVTYTSYDELDRILNQILR